MIKPLNAKDSILHIHTSVVSVNDSITEHIEVLQAKKICKILAIATPRLDGDVVAIDGKHCVGSVSLSFGFESVLTVPIYVNNEAVHIKKEGIEFENEQYTGNTFTACISVDDSAYFDECEVKLYYFYEYE